MCPNRILNFDPDPDPDPTLTLTLTLTLTRGQAWDGMKQINDMTLAAHYYMVPSLGVPCALLYATAGCRVHSCVLLNGTALFGTVVDGVVCTHV